MDGVPTQRQRSGYLLIAQPAGYEPEDFDLSRREHFCGAWIHLPLEPPDLCEAVLVTQFGHDLGRGRELLQRAGFVSVVRQLCGEKQPRFALFMSQSGVVEMPHGLVKQVAVLRVLRQHRIRQS